jgi:hypothetical protein
MESWRAYTLLEGVKDNPKETEKFLDLLSQEKNQQVVNTYTQKLETDPDVQRVVADLQKMLSDVTDEADAELEENLEDLSLQAGVTVLNIKDKVEKYLDSNPVGRRIKQYGPALLGLGIASLAITGVGEADPTGGMKLAAKIASKPLTADGIAQAAVELGSEAITEKRNQ